MRNEIATMESDIKTQPRITVCVPIYGRPLRTRRLIDCLRKQTISNVQVFLIGDACPLWQTELDSGFIDAIVADEAAKGNEWIAMNLEKNFGGFGFHARNLMKTLATGTFLCFVDNDDVLSPRHLEFYLSEIEGTDLNFVYYNVWDETRRGIRDAQLQACRIGHAELCIRTAFFRDSPDEPTHYGHDWVMVDGMLKRTSKFKKSSSPMFCTYSVMSTDTCREIGID